MRILYVTHQFLPEHVAGTEILTYRTAKECMRRGHDVHVFTGCKVPDPAGVEAPFDEYIHEGISVSRYSFSWDTAMGTRNQMLEEYYNELVHGYFADMVRRLRPELVHIHHLQRLSASLIAVCRDNTIPVIFTATDYWTVCPICQLLLPDGSLCPGPDAKGLNCVRHMAEFIGRGRVLRFLPDGLLSPLLTVMTHRAWPDTRYGPKLRALVNRPAYIRSMMAMVDRILVTTDFMKEKLSGFGIDEEKFIVLPFGVECRDGAPETPRGTGKTVRFGYVGTLSHHKGVHVICEAVRRVRAAVSFTVDIYGDEDLFPAYVEKLRSIVGADTRVRFRGTFAPERLWDVLDGMDVLIIPSLWYENTPLILHSAQADRVPVVASNLVGLNEIIADGENGLLFEPGDAGGLARIIERLCDRRGLIDGLSQGARPPLSMPAYVDRLEEIYRDVVTKET